MARAARAAAELAAAALGVRELDERLFHEDIPEDVIARVFEVMGRAHRHTFQALTKRHDRLAELAPRLAWHRNVRMGVTIGTGASSGVPTCSGTFPPPCASSPPSR